MFITPAYAQAAGAGQTSLLTSGLIPMVLIFAIMYFLMIRPQQKKMKEHKALVEALRRGDQVVTQGGIIGKISRVKDGENEVEVEIAEGVRVRIARHAITNVISKTEPAAAAASKA
jgi:preprotein translocase subunit YajC